MPAVHDAERISRATKGSNVMSASRDHGITTDATARRARTPAVLMILALLCALGAVALSPTVRAEMQNPALKDGISAFQAGAFNIALETLEPLAKADNPEAAYWLGRMYEDGLGVKKDVDKAVTYYRKAAAKGLQNAKLRLGEIYFRGTEELQNFEKAHKWLERAAFGGNSVAQRELGTLYANGWGAQKDPVWAYVWYEFAAKQGDYEAQKLRDNLLKTMPDDEITEAQKLTQKIAPEVFGLVEDQSHKTQPPSKQSKADMTTSAPKSAESEK